jgi:hypothetical protein
MAKTLIWIFVLIFALISISSTTALPLTYNSYTGKLDYYGIMNFSCGINQAFTGYSNNGTATCSIVTGSSTYNVTYAQTSADVSANRSNWFSTYNATYDGMITSKLNATDQRYNVTNQNITVEDINAHNIASTNITAYQIGNTSIWSRNGGDIFPTAWDDYGPFSTPQLGIGTNTPDADITIGGWTPDFRMQSITDNPTIFYMGDRVGDLFTMYQYPVAQGGNMSISSWGDIVLLSGFGEVVIDDNLNVYDNEVVTGNVTASYFKGNGSLLTGLTNYSIIDQGFCYANFYNKSSNIDTGVYNITATEFVGKINWTFNQNYPTACTDYQVGVGDVLTCGTWSSANNQILSNAANVSNLADSHTHKLANITINSNLVMNNLNITNVSYLKFQNDTRNLWRMYVNGSGALITEYVVE